MDVNDGGEVAFDALGNSVLELIEGAHGRRGDTGGFRDGGEIRPSEDGLDRVVGLTGKLVGLGGVGAVVEDQDEQLDF
jgi:hypothetical protein